MKLLKTVPLLLVSLLLALVGCSSNNNASGTTNTTQSATPSDSTQESVTVPDTNHASAEAPDEISYITAADAESAALAHAGVTADDVQNLRSEFDYDNGTAEYDVDFVYDGHEYDYDINAVTGEVTWHEKEPENTNNSDVGSDTDNSSNSVKLNAAEAEAIALKHAGYTADEVKGLKSKRDRDNGVYEYDIEFYAGGYEFDYEINAETGKIISFDKEWDD